MVCSPDEHTLVDGVAIVVHRAEGKQDSTHSAQHSSGRSDLDDFWRYILGSATNGGHGRLCSLLGQPKVCNLDLVNVVGSGQQQVLQLQISMHNTSAPDMTDCH